VSVDKISFSFGKNWNDFVLLHLNQARIKEAGKSLRDFLELQTLEGMTFLDIGCGSGLFSLAAYKMGAAEIVSFDYDPFSVKCCEYLKDKEGNPANWTVSKGSILDNVLLEKIKQADIVYSWGVLHHTGDMWQAIRNAAGFVKPGGLFYIAIYNKVQGPFGSETWLALKRFYNRRSKAGKKIVESLFVSMIILKMLATLKNPISEIRRYRKNRGMSFIIDIRDSLGGYPYEYASADEIFNFCKKELGFTLENIKTVNSLSLNEFLFRKSKN